MHFLKQIMEVEVDVEVEEHLCVNQSVSVIHLSNFIVDKLRTSGYPTDANNINTNILQI